MKSQSQDIESRNRPALFKSVAFLSAILLLAFAGIVGCEKKQAKDSQSNDESPAVEGEPSEREPAKTAPDEVAPTEDPGEPAGAEPKDEPKTPGTLDDRLIPTDEMKPSDAPTDPIMQAEENPENGADEEGIEDNLEDLAQNEGEDDDSELAE